MPRGAKCRFVGFFPPFVDFRPQGSEAAAGETVYIKIEELEAIRLKDFLKLEQEECAQRMQISRPTFQRILTEVRSKIADALLNGKAIRIEGGDYCLGSGYCWRHGKQLSASDECSMRPFLDQLESNEPWEVKIMKDMIAISSTTADPSSSLNERFGRCSYMQFWNQETGFQQALPNSNLDAGHGAGTGTAQLVLNQRAGVVITSRIGPKAFAVLKRAGVEVYACPGPISVLEAIDKYKSGSLEKLEAANN